MEADFCLLSIIHTLHMLFHKDYKTAFEFTLAAVFLVQVYGINCVDNLQVTIEVLTLCERFSSNLQEFI